MLRTRLTEITENGKPESHIDLIEGLRPQHPHSIVALTDVSSDLRYNCSMYAFGIEQNQEYVDLVMALPAHIHADTKFIEFLIDRGYLAETDKPSPGLVAVYLDNGQVRHIGRLVSEARVVSKWGLGHLYEHEVLEAPSSYGDKVRFFTPPLLGEVVALFRKYAKARRAVVAKGDG